MTQSHSEPAPSKAAIRSHPVHPMLIPFPIAFLVGALGTDLTYWATTDPFWARASLWLVGAGVVTGAVAAIFGATDFFSIRRARELTIGWVHALGNATVLILSLISWLIRVADPAAAVLPWGLILSIVVVAMLGVTGWVGGEMSYRYRIGVTSSARDLS